MKNPSSEETLRSLVDRFWETVPPAWHQIRGQIRATASSDFDITVEQFHILRYIRKGLGSVSELAAARQISRPAVSQALDVLVARGLVSRAESAADRRFVTLALTADGNELLNAIFHKNSQWMIDRLSVLSQEELDDLLRGMRVLKKLFVEPAP